MFTMPLALAGGIFGLYITQTAIGATVIVGAVLLVGIVVNNAIIMVELANQIRERDDVDRQTAILQAAPQRLRPILMTTITTVVRNVPLSFGNWRRFRIFTTFRDSSFFRFIPSNFIHSVYYSLFLYPTPRHFQLG